MKTLLASLILISSLAFNPSALADESAEQAAAQLLDSMGMETILDGMIEVALDQQIAKNPELAPFKSIMRQFLTKHLSYEVLRPKLATAYAAEFSAEELLQAAEFYATPTGKKFLEKMPILYAKGSQIGQDSINEHIPELQQAIQGEVKRLQELQQESDTN